MKCPKCQTKTRIGDNDNFCRNCGFPLNGVEFKNSTRKLKSFQYDAELKCLFVNGIAQERVTAFSLECKDGKCSLLLSRDEVFEEIN